MTYSRKQYEESGEVSPLGALLATAALVVPTIAVAFALGGLNFTSFCPVLVVAVVGGLIVGGSAGWLFRQAHVRNRVVAAVVAATFGGLAYLGQFHTMLILNGGPQLIPRVDLAPQCMIDTVNGWAIGQPGNNNNQPVPFVNWLLFIVELAACAGMAGFFAYKGAERAYCERCGRWMDEASVKLLFPEGQVLANAIAASQFDSLPNLVRARDASAQHVVVTVEHCGHFDGSPPVWYISLEENHGQNSQEHAREILTRVELTKEEVQILLRQLPELFPSVANMPVA